jgi:hypothetical protein
MNSYGLDPMGALSIGVVIVGFSFLIFYSIIESATKSKKIAKLQEAQVKITLKNGVEAEKIDAIVEDKNERLTSRNFRLVVMVNLF